MKQQADARAAADFVDRIDQMLDDDAMGWAFQTLDGIRGRVVATGIITPGQEAAVENIAATARRQALERKGPAADVLPSSQRADGFAARRYEGGGN